MIHYLLNLVIKDIYRSDLNDYYVACTLLNVVGSIHEEFQWFKK